jgi:hypothetical protein
MNEGRTEGKRKKEERRISINERRKNERLKESKNNESRKQELKE